MRCLAFRASARIARGDGLRWAWPNPHPQAIIPDWAHVVAPQSLRGPQGPGRIRPRGARARSCRYRVKNDVLGGGFLALVSDAGARNLQVPAASVYTKNQHFRVHRRYGVYEKHRFWYTPSTPGKSRIPERALWHVRISCRSAHLTQGQTEPSRADQRSRDGLAVIPLPLPPSSVSVCVSSSSLFAFSPFSSLLPPSSSSSCSSSSSSSSSSTHSH